MLSKQHLNPTAANPPANPTGAGQVAATGVAVVPANPAASVAASASAAKAGANPAASGGGGKASPSPAAPGGGGRATIVDFTQQPNGQPAGQQATMPYDAPANAPILWVEFGHGSTNPADKNPTIVKQLAYVPG